MTKCQYLKPGKLNYLEDNLGSTYRPDLCQAAQAVTDRKGVRRARKAVNKWTASHNASSQRRTTPFLEFSGCDSTSFIRYGTSVSTYRYNYSTASCLTQMILECFMCRLLVQWYLHCY